MKKLEELGISPTPWKVCDERSLGGDVIGIECAEKFAYLVAGDVILKEADATIMSAAPELYQALWFQCFGNTGVGNCRNCKGAELGNCKTCPLGNARAALAKASGEGEVAP